jgi:hypothetical protein
MGAFSLALAVTPFASVSSVIAGPAVVTSAPLDVALRYEATAECPEREAFLDLVRLRSPHVRLLEPDPTPAPQLEKALCLLSDADRDLRRERPDDRIVMEQLVVGMTN